MGNCLACFKDKTGRRSSYDGAGSCKYQPPGRGAATEAATTTVTTKEQQDVASANLNNNYPPTYSQQQQHRHNLTNRDVLEQSEIRGLLGAPEGTTAVNTQTTTTSSSETTSTTNYGGLKLLKKPMNILNGNLGLSGTGNSSSSNSSKPPSQQPLIACQISDNKINALFETYRDEECQDSILAPGIERLCCDLNYKPEDFAVLVLAWRLDASQMCRFTKTEFIQGLHTLSADSIQSIRERLEEQVVRLTSDGELFKNLYRFTFRFGLETDLRTLPLDMAISLWRLVFTVHTPEILPKWLDYLENLQQIRGIPKDTWNMFLNFAETCDINSYSDEDAWPSVFDDFVEYETERRLNDNKDEGAVGS